jgi:hypothetical protein
MSLAYTNFIKELKFQHGQNTWHTQNNVNVTQFNKFALENSIEPQLTTILAIKVLYSFPTCFKGCIMFINLIFTF